MNLIAQASRQPPHQAIRDIYSAALEPARWPAALQAVADIFGDVGAILIYARDDGTFGVVCSPSLQHCVGEYALGWSDRDTRAIRGRERGFFVGRDVITDRDVITPDLAVYVLPVSAQAGPAAQFLTHTRAIVLVIDPRAGEPADPALVRDVLGLTLGEARVASLVGSGLAPRAAAEQLGIAEETARSTLKSVFSKVGVSRQSELAALLARLVLR
jgi:DNA-binding CsgD family transcriptional regulator